MQTLLSAHIDKQALRLQPVYRDNSRVNPSIHLPPRLDVDGSGYICATELGDLFREVGCPLPGYQIRELLQKLDRDKDSRINLEEFTAVGNAN